jgi:hypothetical protein
MGARTDVWLAPLPEALGDIRTAAPPLQDFNEGDASLRWSGGEHALSEELGNCFWEFLALADAPDEDIVRFARRYGPLTGFPVSTEEEFDRARSEGRGSTGSTAEPVAIWRTLSQGLGGLFDLVDPALPAASVTPETWIQAVGAVVVSIWLNEPGLPDPPYDFMATDSGRLLVGDYALRPDWLVTTVLQRAGVGSAFRADPRYGPRVGYTLPGREAPSLGRPVWQVAGLLPVLAVSLAVAAQTKGHARCTWCGKPAAIGKRRPRTGQRWYGDHASCRALARAKTMNLAEDKRAAKRRLSKSQATPVSDADQPQGVADLMTANAN